ncbi:MAG: alpha/beta hydrolase [Myxococcota bacterium]
MKKVSSLYKRTLILLISAVVASCDAAANDTQPSPHGDTGDEKNENEKESSWAEFSYEPYPLPYYVDDVDRYPAAKPPKGTVNRHGELEYVGNSHFGAHWFVEANGAVWHFVTAGDPSNDVALLIHGHPDTWYAFSKVMALLADNYYVIAVDTLGYGQSDKRSTIDVSYAAVAKSLIVLLGRIGVQDFNLLTHDRGSVISDHLVAADGLNKRIRAFLRMQQSFDKPHGFPRPGHAAMATAEWQRQDIVRRVYRSKYASVHIPDEELNRLAWEFGFEGTAEAAARTFQGTSFDVEREFRMKNTVPKMTMPVVILQGIHDPGQHPEEYSKSAELIPNGRVVLVEANHFIHSEDPALVARVAHDLFQNGHANRPNKISTEVVNFIYPEKPN